MMGRDRQPESYRTRNPRKDGAKRSHFSQAGWGGAGWEGRSPPRPPRPRRGDCAAPSCGRPGQWACGARAPTTSCRVKPTFLSECPIVRLPIPPPPRHLDPAPRVQASTLTTSLFRETFEKQPISHIRKQMTRLPDLPGSSVRPGPGHQKSVARTCDQGRGWAG